MKKFLKRLRKAMGTSTNGDSLEKILNWMQQNIQKEHVRGGQHTNRLDKMELQIAADVANTIQADRWFETNNTKVELLEKKVEVLVNQYEELLRRQDNLDKRVP